MNIRGEYSTLGFMFDMRNRMTEWFNYSTVQCTSLESNTGILIDDFILYFVNL